MRLAGVTTIEAANQFLEEYLPIYNSAFVQPARPQISIDLVLRAATGPDPLHQDRGASAMT